MNSTWSHTSNDIMMKKIDELSRSIDALTKQMKQLKDALQYAIVRERTRDVCCICGCELSYRGHDPWPVKPHPKSPYSRGDKCCAVCNEYEVIPARNKLLAEVSPVVK